MLATITNDYKRANASTNIGFSIEMDTRVINTVIDATTLTINAVKTTYNAGVTARLAVDNTIKFVQAFIYLVYPPTTPLPQIYQVALEELDEYNLSKHNASVIDNTTADNGYIVFGTDIGEQSDSNTTVNGIALDSVTELVGEHRTHTTTSTANTVEPHAGVDVNSSYREVQKALKSLCIAKGINPRCNYNASKSVLLEEFNHIASLVGA